MTTEEKQEIARLRKQGHGYKAISTSTGVPIPTIISMLNRESSYQKCECKLCGSSFIQYPHRKQKIFCSDKCRMLWWNSHLDKVNRKAFYQNICQCCGKEFISYGNNHRIFCSRKCSADNRRSKNEQ